MSAWLIIPPLVAYAALLGAARGYRAIGINAMAWFYVWLVLTVAWFGTAHVLGW